MPSSTTKTAQKNRSHSSFTGMETDIVIPIIGPIGAGKTTFINIALDDNLRKVGHGMGPCTTEPSPVVVDPSIHRFTHPILKDHRLVLLDTPGFDNPSKDDEQILKQIVKWLTKSYPKKVIVGGVLYIHDITNKKFKAADRQIMEVFHGFHRKYRGSAIQNTILATTNWGPPKPEDSENREKELMNTHWVTMISQGAELRRFLLDSESAWAIINDLLGHIVETQKALEDSTDDKGFIGCTVQ